MRKGLKSFRAMRYGASELARLDRHPRRPDDPFHMVEQATSALAQVRRHARAQAGKGLESANTRIRLITRIAFGFGDPAALIPLAMLSPSGYRPPRHPHPEDDHGYPVDTSGQPVLSDPRARVELEIES